MQQIVQNLRSGKVEKITVPMPACGRGEVLVATQASLISAGTEKMLMDFAGKSLIGKAQERPDLVRKVKAKISRNGLLDTLRGVFARLDEPLPLGYSAAGTVIEVGANLKQQFHIGQGVAIAGAGLANHAEFNAVPRNLAVPLPKGVSMGQGAYATLGAIALQGVRQAEVKLGDRVLVVGLGLVGQLAAQLAAAAGARVAAVDPNPARAQLARQCGGAIGAPLWAVGPAALAEGFGQFTDGRGFDAILMCASSESPALITQAAEWARDRATIVLVGKIGTAFPFADFMKKELQVRVSRSYGPGRYDPAYEQGGLTYPIGYVPHTERDHLAEVVHLIGAGKLNVDLLTSHTFALEHAEQAYALLSSNQPSLGVVLTYPPAVSAAVPAGAETGGNTTVKNPATNVTGKVMPPTSPGPAQPLGVSVLGSGAFARGVLVPALHAAGVTFRHILSKTGLSAAHVAKKVGGTAGTAFTTALNDPLTHAVVIATRHAAHANQVVSALQAGKHVWVEKPLALELPDLQRVEATLAAFGGQPTPILMVGFNRRFSPALTPLKSRLSTLSGPKQILIRVNAGRLEPSWQHSAEGGGRLLGEVCHFTDLALWLAGSPVTAARAISGQGQDVFAITLQHADGSLSQILYSSEGDPAAPKEFVEVLASGAIGRMENYRRTTWHQRGKCLTLYRQKFWQGQQKGHAQAIAAWVAACAGKASTLPPLAELLHSSRLILNLHRNLNASTPLA